MNKAGWRSVAGIVAIGLLGGGALGAAPSALEEVWSKGPLGSTAEELLAVAKALPVPEDAEIEYLDRRDEVSYDEEGRETMTRYVLFRLLTEEGVDEYASAGLAYSPWHQERPEVRYRVITPGGEVFNLDPTTLSESPIASDSDDIFEDRLFLEAPLPAVEVGAIVEGVRVRRDKAPFFPAGSVVENTWEAGYGPTQRRTIEVSVPKGTAFTWRSSGVDGVEPEITERDGRTIHTFEAHNLGDGSAFEPGLPPEIPSWSTLRFTTASSWTEVAETYGAWVDDRVGEGALPAIDLPADDRRAKIDTILAWVHDHVRYTGLELGAAAIVPVSPQTALERRYGDCKDKSTLVTALLRREGIEARVVLLRAATRRDLDPDLPGLGQMNHAIVYLPEDDLWIDPTDPKAPAGSLPVGDQDRWALLTGEDGRLVKTPAETAAENRVEMETRVEMAAHGKATIRESMVALGASQSNLRLLFELLGQEHLESLFERLATERYLAETLESFTHSDVEDLSEPIRLELVASGAKRGSTDLDSAVYAIRFEPLFDGMPDPLLEEPDDAEPRENDYYHPPYSYQWRFDIAAPRGMRPREVPEHEKIEWDGGFFEATFTETPEGLSAVYEVVSGDRRLSPEAFERTREKVAAVASRDPQLLWFDHSASAHIAAGRTVEAVALLHDLVESDPRDALNRVRLARLLVQVGLGPEARRLANEAIVLEPDSAVVAWLSSAIMQYDEIGRHLATGADLPRTRELLDQAVELDPEDSRIAFEWALFHEYDDTGERYSEEAPLGEAVAAYRKYLDEFDLGEMEGNLLFCLHYTEQWDELIEEAEEMADTTTRNSLVVSAIAMTEGVEAALERAERLTTEQSTFGELLRNTATQLAAVQRYEESGRILSRMAAGSEDPSAILNEARVIRKARPLDLSSRPTTAKELGRHWLAQLLRKEPDPEAILELMAPALAERFEADPEFFDLHFGRIRGAIDSIESTLPRHILIDLIIGGTTFKEKSKGAGFTRLDYSSQNFGVGIEQFLLLEQMAEGPRIIGMSAMVGQVGRTLLDLVERGELERARGLYELAGDGEEIDEPADPLDPAMAFAVFLPSDAETEEALRRAAAVLMIDRLFAEDAAEALRSEIESATGKERLALRTALQLAYFAAEDWERASEVSLALATEHTDSLQGLLMAATALASHDDLETLRSLATDRLEDDDQGVDALRILGDSAVQAGDGEAARKIYLELEEMGEAAPSDYNQLAWMALYDDPVPEEALDYALQAVEADGSTSYGVLHTIATVFAALGRPQEAYKVIMQAIESKPGSAPDDQDWLCFGWIAEGYGLTEAAIAFYERVEPEEGGYTSYELVQRRLAKLKGAS